MSLSISNLLERLDTLLESISDKVNTKLGRTEAAVSANKLTENFRITVTGDIEGTVDVDGSKDETLTLTLPRVLTSPGIGTKVTVNDKGLVTEVGPQTAADVPNLPASKVSSGEFNLDRIPSLPASKVGSGVFDAQRIPLPTKLASNRTISMTGDGTWQVTGDLSSNMTGSMTLSNTGVQAGSYGSAREIPTFTLDSKGRVVAVAVNQVQAQAVFAVKETVTIAANGTRDFDLQTILTAAVWNGCDKPATDIMVRIKDTDANSPTYNGYINSESTIVAGLLNDRTVRLVNYTNASVELYVKITVHPV